MTERLHIDYIKTPCKNTNGHDYASQICRNLDRKEKCQYFDLATQLRDAVSLDSDLNEVDDPDQMFDTDKGDWQTELPDIAQVLNPGQKTDLFAVSIKIRSQADPPASPGRSPPPQPPST